MKLSILFLVLGSSDILIGEENEDGDTGLWKYLGNIMAPKIASAGDPVTISPTTGPPVTQRPESCLTQCLKDCGKPPLPGIYFFEESF